VTVREGDVPVTALTPARPVTAILAGGLAERLGPIAAAVPKSMVKVGGEPFIAHQLRQLAAQSFTEVVVCAGYLGERIEEFVGTGGAFGCDVRYSFDGDKLLGTGGALRRALPMLGSHFLVMYGDSYLTQPFGPVWEAFIESGKAALMTVFQNDGLWDRSNVEFAAGRIRRYEKPLPGETDHGDGETTRPMRHIDYGLGCISADELGKWSSDHRFDLARFYQAMVERQELAAFEVKDRFYEIGSPQGLVDTEAFLTRAARAGVGE
jgi:MurNAc alpha-1-phosphate uridylyltransferase